MLELICSVLVIAMGMAIDVFYRDVTVWHGVCLLGLAATLVGVVWLPNSKKLQ